MIICPIRIVNCGEQALEDLGADHSISGEDIPDAPNHKILLRERCAAYLDGGYPHEAQGFFANE